MKNDIDSLINSFKGNIEGFAGGGSNNYLKKMQSIDDHLNQLKFLESKIQETNVSKDKDKDRIGLFNFITKE